MFLCRCRRSKVGGVGFLKLISQAFPRPLTQSPLVFFPLFRQLSFSLALRYLNAWNRLFSCWQLLICENTLIQVVKLKKKERGRRNKREKFPISLRAEPRTAASEARC